MLISFWVKHDVALTDRQVPAVPNGPMVQLEADGVVFMELFVFGPITLKTNTYVTGERMTSMTAMVGITPSTSTLSMLLS